MGSTLNKRQYYGGYGDGDSDYWWESPTTIIVKWVILAVIFLLLVAFFGGGYLHAKRRMRKGLPPLAYHRFLVPRHRRAQFERQPFPERNHYSIYNPNGPGNADFYGMHTVPPPAYNPNLAPPPSYQPPMGASKAAPDQSYTAAGPSTAAPLPSRDGAASMPSEGTGSTNPYK